MSGMKSRSLLLAVAMVAWAIGSHGVAAGSDTTQAYRPGTFGSPSTEIVGYTGERLELQVVDVGASAPEPTIGVAADGTAYLGASDLLLNTLVNGGLIPNTLKSTDGGRTWTSIQNRLPVADRASSPASVDPYVHVDTDTGRVFNIDLYGGCSWLNFSDDGGQTWGTNPMACGEIANDHQTIITGPPPPLLRPLMGDYPNVLYYCFQSLTVMKTGCSRSLDGGLTFVPTVTPAFTGFDEDAGGLCGAIVGHIKTDSAGRLYLPKGHCGHPWLAVSADGGDTWRRTKVSDLPNHSPHQAVNSEDDELLPPRGAARHLSVALDTADNVYFTWWDHETALPYLQISTDHGQTWSAPMMVAPPGVTEVSLPVVVAGDPGRVALSFLSSSADDRHDPGRAWDHHVVMSVTAMDEDPVFISALANPPSDPVHRGSCWENCGGVFHFIDADLSPAGELWATSSDDCVDACVTDPAARRLQLGNGLVIRQVGGPSLRPSLETSVNRSATSG